MERKWEEEDCGPLPRRLRVLSLGAGVQSSTLALMMAHGELRPVDHAIFADTQGEPAEVYAWLDTLEQLIKPLPYAFPIHRVTAGSLADNELRVRTSRLSGKKYLPAKIPAFVKNADGTRGLLGRKCTADFKIVPVTQKIRALLDITRAKPGQHLVEQSIGISRDEAHRMKPSRTPWIECNWPLVDAGMTRDGCLRWMADKGYPVPPRSACGFCPFHSDNEWIRLRDEHPVAFEEAALFEERLQEAATRQEVLNGKPFLHSACIPLRLVPFKTLPANQQISLFGNECEGMCGV